MTIYLASTSPRRLALCAQIGLSVTVLDGASVDETPIQGENPAQFALRMARAKAQFACELNIDWQDGDVLIAADTVVAKGRRILPKTDDVAQATDHLDLLSGSKLRVWGGLAVWLYGQGAWLKHNRLVKTRIKFVRIAKQDKQEYLSSKEWHGCAGSFAIQGQAARFVQNMQGSYSNVVGMDVATLWRLLPKNAQEKP